MRMNGNDLAACAVIALGVGGVVVGSLLGVGNQAVTLPAVNPQPVVVDMPTEPEPTATPEPTPEPTPTVETVHFSATGDDLIHDGIFLQARERGGDHYDFDAAYAAMQGYYDQFDVNWLNQETLVNDEFAASGYPMFSTPGEITDTLYNLGFRVFSLSNNHSYDKGAAGIEASMAHWAAMPDDVVTMGFYNLETYDNYAYQTATASRSAISPIRSTPTACPRRPAQTMALCIWTTMKRLPNRSLICARTAMFLSSAPTWAPRARTRSTTFKGRLLSGWPTRASMSSSAPTRM